ncbi:MAG: hypothetical protein ACYS0D_03715 [Planctomycetota bacterium]
MKKIMQSQQRVVRIQVLGQEGRERVMRGYRWASSRPSWVARAAAVAFLIVVGLPILVLVLLAIVAAAVVFGVLAATDALLRAVRGPRRVEDGRENVRVRRFPAREPHDTRRAGDG